MNGFSTTHDTYSVGTANARILKQKTRAVPSLVVWLDHCNKTKSLVRYPMYCQKTFHIIITHKKCGLNPMHPIQLIDHPIIWWLSKNQFPISPRFVCTILYVIITDTNLWDIISDKIWLCLKGTNSLFATILFVIIT